MAPGAAIVRLHVRPWTSLASRRFASMAVMAEIRFRAMGSDCHVIVVGGPSGLVGVARERLDRLERIWSRFIDDSEVSRLNRAGGEAVHVSPETIELVERAQEAWRLSGGAFDPTVLGAVIRAGYDRSFDRMGPAPTHGRSGLGLGAADITVDGDTVRLPAGIGFDPGGIGKGLASDLVATELRAAGAAGVCVNMGGDVRVTGAGPDGGSWTVAVEHPWTERPVALLGLGDGAVATSTTLRRRWWVDGSPAHHLIDPQTGLPSATDVNLATVVAAGAWAAEVLTKAVLLAGSRHPFDILGGTGAQGLVVDDSGGVQATGGLADYLGGERLPAVIARPPGA